jgi:hypothetical protein
MDWEAHSSAVAAFVSLAKTSRATPRYDADTIIATRAELYVRRYLRIASAEVQRAIKSRLRRLLVKDGYLTNVSGQFKQQQAVTTVIMK